MKEATGELNMTVITVLIIAGLGVVASIFVVPMISTGIKRNGCASMLGVDVSEITKASDTECCAGEDNCVAVTETADE